ncbi:hypothetical protein O6H91_14G077500 [Diphasiastrum complanatum]|uniref:Uncharacterized protein n=2 Tax=Diphasiastrum complanatum TaxID=34168 RepID=A0ACC2BQY3_DIPCM|nr:hypothetical protein O6H91_14G077500 [Diphasiastrum complanatum]KAJ7532213.1 hypothetical protein O6H91_14G077500 [Diphasiastrum complanatum]
MVTACLAPIASSSACFPSSYTRCFGKETSAKVFHISRCNGLRLFKEDIISRGQTQDLSVLLHTNIHQAISTRRSARCRGQVTMMPIGTPKVPYRTPQEGGWQWVDIWNVLYRERIIFIGQYIDEEFGNQLIATMLYLDSLDSSKNLFLYLNSPGGDITPSMALYDTMESIKSPVGTVAVGYAYNTAGFLLAAGNKGSRLAMPLTRISLQSPSGAARGKADDIQNEARELLRVRSYVFQQLAIKTGQPLEKITKDLSRIKRFNSQEALEYGLIDRIIRPQRVKADASPKPEAGVGIG